MSKIKEKYTRILYFALAISLSGNVCLALLSAYLYSQNFFVAIPIEIPQVKRSFEPLALNLSLDQVLGRLYRSSWNVLVDALTVKTVVENGYRLRDIALGTLVQKYDFDIAKALASLAYDEQVRTMPCRYASNGEIKLWHGFQDEHFNAIIQFARKERWPQTPRRLFTLLKKKRESAPDSLFEAFTLTPHYLAARSLFSAASGGDSPDVTAKEVAAILLDGSWEMAEALLSEYKATANHGDAFRRRFLLRYLALESTSAACSLLRNDFAFAVKKIDDESATTLLRCLKEKSNAAIKFAVAMLTSPRGDALRKAAAESLYRYSGEVISEPYDYGAALARFAPAALQRLSCGVVKPLPSLKSEGAGDSLYVVQSGDSLWKIARRFHVPVEILLRHNSLNDDLIMPGTSLRIPRQQGRTVTR